MGTRPLEFLRLIQLTLVNFKGIRNLQITLDGHDLDVYGDNATGKTTIYDAFLWLLFGKDSQGRTDFEIKTLDANGQPIPDIPHTVEAELELRGVRFRLRKTLVEKWVKRRGSAVPEFTGHNVEYFIDDVPVKKQEYDAKIREICDEELFKLLTSPLYFNVQLPWQKRRELLLRIAGDVDDSAVISRDPALAELPDILKGQRVEDAKRRLQNQQAQVKKEIASLPARIAEAQRMLPDLPPEITLEAIEKDLSDKVTILRSIQAKLTGGNTKSDAEFISLNSQLNLLKQEYQRRISVLRDLQSKRTEYRLQRDEILKREPDITVPTVCPTCGQRIPKSKQEEVRARQIQEFEQRQQADLDRVVNEIDRLGEEIRKLRKPLQQLERDIVVLENKLLKLSKQVVTEVDVERLKQRMARLETEIDRLQRLREAIRTRDTILQRIDELKSAEKDLVSQFDELERQIRLCDLFVQRKVQLIEDRINSMFRLAKFKLFDTQVNGQVVETCIVTYNGVPFPDLNHGAQINVGLDLIRTFAEHYHIAPPVFVDNAEAITRLVPVPAQVIRLVVSPDHPTLTWRIVDRKAGE